MMPYSLRDRYQHFRKICYLHLHDQSELTWESGKLWGGGRKTKSMRMTKQNSIWGKDKQGPDQLKENVGPKKDGYSKNLYRLRRGNRQPTANMEGRTMEEEQNRWPWIGQI